MIFVKEPLESQDLPAVLTGEVVCQSLQFVQHDILDVIVVKHWVQKEAVLIGISIYTDCLVEKGLTSGLRSEINGLLCSAIRHHLRKVMHV